MNMLKRISATITSSVDKAVTKVENHDAIINAALQETQQAAARSRVRLARVQKDGNSLTTRRDNLTAAVRTWTARAKSVARTDEQKALECLRRKRDCESQLKNLEQAIANHNDLETRVSENLQKIEARISEVSHQRNMMRSRQSVAEANRIVSKIEGVSYGEIEDTFDRWEINLGETEIMHGSNSVSDVLENDFLAAEDSAELKAELEMLIDKDGETQS